jgi:hypothetical protein
MIETPQNGTIHHEASQTCNTSIQTAMVDNARGNAFYQPLPLDSFLFVVPAALRSNLT